VEKDVDDPSTPSERESTLLSRGATTPTALTRLFAAPEITSPTLSRHASYLRTPSGTTYNRGMSIKVCQNRLLTFAATIETAPLPSHLYTRGLLNGRHSDITVHAFGTNYALHRLILDRAPFFSSALSEPWFESTSKDITLHPEDVDSNITQAAFELALKKLYGCDISTEEDGEAIGLFATGCWLEMMDLIETSVNAILRQMKPSTLGTFVRLVTSNYYGKAGDRILASAKAMLCREGWEMSIRHWDNISGEIAREIIGGDGFFVPDEWERFVLAKRVLDRKLKKKVIEAGLVEPNGKVRRVPPDTANFHAIRFDTVYRKNMPMVGRQIPEAFDPWIALYTSSDIAPLLVLLDEGIHYVHLSFEELKKIKEQRDALGLPLLPERVISNALWMSMELRQKVLNANELDMELGLAQAADDCDEGDAPSSPTPVKTSTTATNGPSNGKGKQIEVPSLGHGEEEIESGSWDGNGKPRKFWIPNTDSTSVTGGNAETLVSAANLPNPYLSRHISRLSASLDPQDVQWATDFSTVVGERPQTPGRSKTPDSVPPLSYSHYPPFRFADEFPNPRSLKEKKRVYSRTVWYAGSLWNVYIQRVETTKNTQLGVYLHRAKDKEHEGLRHGSVDERIGQVELAMRRNQRHLRQQHQQGDVDEDPGTSSGDPDATLIAPSAETSRANAISSLLRGDPIHKSSQNPLPLSSMPDRTYNPSTLSDSDDPSSLLDYSSTGATTSSPPNANSTEKLPRKRKPTMPAYVDGRPTIKTYFKIYSPSKGGRMLSVYESAPDRFNFSQSWGWKSSTMILDDGMLGYEAAGEPKKPGNLRFMVVIGMSPSSLQLFSSRKAKPILQVTCNCTNDYDMTTRTMTVNDYDLWHTASVGLCALIRAYSA